MTDFDQELENLNKSLLNLNISNLETNLREPSDSHLSYSNQNSNMALNLDHLDKLSKFIPIFSGRDVELPEFITTVENLVRNCPTADAANYSILISAIRSKIKGDARELLLGRSDITTWAQIKDLLTKNYSDNKNLDTLELELQYSCLNPGEHLIQFGQRLISLRARITTKIQSMDITEAEKVGRTNSISNQTFNIFKLNLPHNYEQLIRSRVDIITIEQAINFIDNEIKYDSYKHLTLQNRNFRAQKQAPPTYKQNNHPTITRQPYRQSQKPVQIYQPSNNYFTDNPQFPPQLTKLPITRQVTPNFPTNQQVFSNQRNVWQPNPQQKINYPKPQPMSGVSTIPTSSRNTNSNQNRFNQNRTFSKTSILQPNQPKYITEELFNNQFNTTPMEPHFDQFTGEPPFLNEPLINSEESVENYYPEEWQILDSQNEEQNEQSEQNFHPVTTYTSQT